MGMGGWGRKEIIKIQNEYEWEQEPNKHGDCTLLHDTVLLKGVSPSTLSNQMQQSYKNLQKFLTLP